MALSVIAVVVLVVDLVHIVIESTLLVDDLFLVILLFEAIHLQRNGLELKLLLHLVLTLHQRSLRQRPSLLVVLRLLLVEKSRLGIQGRVLNRFDIVHGVAVNTVRVDRLAVEVSVQQRGAFELGVVRHLVSCLLLGKLPIFWVGDVMLNLVITPHRVLLSKVMSCIILLSVVRSESHWESLVADALEATNHRIASPKALVGVELEVLSTLDACSTEHALVVLV